MSFLTRLFEAPLKLLSEWAWDNPLTSAVVATGTSVVAGYTLVRTQFWAKYKRVIAIATLATTGYVAYKKLGPLIQELRKMKAVWDELQANASVAAAKQDEDAKKALEST